MTVSLMGLLHFGQDSSTNNVKGIVSSFRARRTEDTQKGPGKIVRVPASCDDAQSNRMVFHYEFHV